MNFLNRAIKNVQRKKSKTILLIITFFVIGNFVILGLAVSNASENAKVETRKSMRAVVNYQVDYEKVWEYTEDFDSDDWENFEYPTISVEEVRELASDDRVKTVSINNSLRLYSSDIETVVIDNENSKEENSRMCWEDEDGNEVCEIYREADLNLKANFYPNYIEFEDEEFILKEGRMYTQEDLDNNERVCLITEELAELNNLRVGDILTTFMENPDSVEEGGYLYGQMTAEDIMIELEIIGIFENTKVLDPTSDDFRWLPSSMAPGNVVLAPITTMSDFQYQRDLKRWEMQKEEYPDEEYFQDPDNAPKIENYSNFGLATFLLNDPLEVDQFVEDYNENLEDEFKMFDANNETFEKLSKPLETMSMVSSFIVWLVVINAIIIITLVTALTLKNREYEIGVLLSLGTSKFKIISQFFVELAIVSLIGFTLSNVTGSMLADKVGEVAWSYQTEYDGVSEITDDEPSYWYGDSDYFTDVTFEDVSGNYDVSISPLLIAQIYVVGLGIVLVAILIPSMMIMRFSPKRILMSAQ